MGPSAQVGARWKVRWPQVRDPGASRRDKARADRHHAEEGGRARDAHHHPPRGALRAAGCLSRWSPAGQ
eukprot:15464092-Alexandrium_andersonii.AAC.1